MISFTDVFTSRTSKPFILMCALVLIFQCFINTEAHAKRNATCLWCHTDEQFTEAFPESAHQIINCATCHQGIEDVYLHKIAEEEITTLSCVSCHEDISKTVTADVHVTQEKMSCLECHNEIHTAPKSNPETFKATASASCLKCHETEKYSDMGHGASLANGNSAAASCVDCHTLHATTKVQSDDPAIALAIRTAQAENCIQCHSDSKIIADNGLKDVVNSYNMTYHGKSMALGGDTATCVDCHTGHSITGSNDINSPLNPVQLAETCGKCHDGSSESFATYVAHPDYHDSEGFPVLYWMNFFMECLLASVFTFFFIHTLLWWRKAYWLKWNTKTVPVVDVKEKEYVRRFSVLQILMHIALVTSFMVLVLTGFPLKYPDAAWAQFLIDIFGGVQSAGIAHRVAGAIEILMSIYVAIASIKFIFLDKERKGSWWSILFGPDSLCPNFKDLRDLKDMFLWFFNKGEQPKFDRWTYFEKFDFFAVFWGMGIIGTSGLIMWFPEAFSAILPGWLINVAAIAHSEEALLAAIFIFTVHFFHNHLVPNKFPMEDNIFTGRYTLDDLKHERPDEYERMVVDGKLESLKAEKPGLLIRLFSSVFGYGAVILGLTLTALIMWAILGM